MCLLLFKDGQRKQFVHIVSIEVYVVEDMSDRDRTIVVTPLEVWAFHGVWASPRTQNVQLLQEAQHIKEECRDLKDKNKKV